MAAGWCVVRCPKLGRPKTLAPAYDIPIEACCTPCMPGLGSCLTQPTLQDIQVVAASSVMAVDLVSSEFRKLVVCL